MNQIFTIAAHTDVGIRKSINQDAMFAAIAEADIGQVVFAAVCDGMGGLEAGEMASAKMAFALNEWFENSLAASMCKDGAMIDFDKFQTEFNFMIRHTGQEIEKESPDMSGTTITALLIAAGRYYTANVGDSRIYLMRDGLEQLTKDQTLIQELLDNGDITEDEVKTHPQRSVLLQCVGASEVIIPVYTSGECSPGDLFLLCSDGFRHEITKAEMEDALYVTDDVTEQELKDMLIRMTELCKARGERDNISSIAIKVKKGGRF